jgi:two-component system, OmpR family, phosphate regulon response regulator PhoB
MALVGQTKQTIVVVEDDMSLRKLVVKHLERVGFDVQPFDNGEAALDHIDRAERAPSLVCLDLALPAMSGFRVCEALRSAPKTRNIPVLILTARTTVQDHTFALEVGADGFLEKPFKLKELEEEIGRLLKGAQ